jgi:hypothetical protein
MLTGARRLAPETDDKRTGQGVAVLAWLSPPGILNKNLGQAMCGGVVAVSTQPKKGLFSFIIGRNLPAHSFLPAPWDLVEVRTNMSTEFQAHVIASGHPGVVSNFTAEVVWGVHAASSASLLRV